ncbi:hypothetical protein BDW68DRAFT_165067 [Aspergillus falconensis]
MVWVVMTDLCYLTLHHSRGSPYSKIGQERSHNLFLPNRSDCCDDVTKTRPAHRTGPSASSSKRVRVAIPLGRVENA